MRRDWSRLLHTLYEIGIEKSDYMNCCAENEPRHLISRIWWKSIAHSSKRTGNITGYFRSAFWIAILHSFTQEIDNEVFGMFEWSLKKRQEATIEKFHGVSMLKSVEQAPRSQLYLTANVLAFFQNASL